MRRLILFLSFAIFFAGCSFSVKNPDTSDTKISENQATPIAQSNSTAVAKVPYCPLTLPPNPSFIPPGPYLKSLTGQFWYGSDSFWTSLPLDGQWNDLPHFPEGYTQKIFWWGVEFDLQSEPEPDLQVTGKRLDAPAPALEASRATNAYASDIGSAMLVGVDFPTLGCWEITGKYQNNTLTFVIRIDK